MAEPDPLAIPTDPELRGGQTSQHYRDVVHLGNDLEEQFGPVADNVEWPVSVVEERNIENAPVLTDKLVQLHPVISVDALVNHVYFFVVNRKPNFLFEFA